MLAVNDVGLAFRRRRTQPGDTCGPLNWIPEAAYHLGSDRRARAGT
jgi:hypothetical protein